MKHDFRYYTGLVLDNLDGVNWYSDARTQIRHVCEREQWCVDRFTSILALTSPRCSVRRNVRLALHYVWHGRHMGNVIRGVRLSVDNWHGTGVIRGPKVSAFRDALRGDENAIVLDVHMANLFDVPQASFSSARGRLPWETLIREVAGSVGVAPRDVQACLWFAQRRRIGELPEAYPIRHEYANWLAHNRSFPDCGSIRQFADRTGHFQPLLIGA